VSQGKLVTIMNYYALFNGILNPKQLEGLRLLVTPFPQQQFNQTEDRRSELPSRGVTCFDCHVNGHTNGATHLVGDIRPQEFRHRLDTPPLRGVNIQRLFGSQRALKSVEDFTEFEQRAAYFDGDPVFGTKKGLNILERGSQVHFMAEFQEILDFPPAPKLDIYGKLDPEKATPSELRGQEVFFGKAKCAYCHASPYYIEDSIERSALLWIMLCSRRDSSTSFPTRQQVVTWGGVGVLSVEKDIVPEAPKDRVHSRLAP
jgi:cytochrome c peroxidase